MLLLFSAIFVKDCDVAKFTICTIDDPRTLNKTLYLRPPGNICSMNQLVEMWEYKIGQKLKTIHISEEQLLKDINGMYHVIVSNIIFVLYVKSCNLMWLIIGYLISETPYPNNMEMIFIYSGFIKGDNTYFDIDSGVDATHLYPDVKYTTISQYLDTLV